MSREKIAELESNIEELKEQLIQLEKDFKVEAEAFLRDFWTSGAKKILTNEPEVMSKLSDDSLRQLKRDIDQFSNETESLVASGLSKDSLWFHKKAAGYRGSPGGRGSYTPPTEFDDTLRLIAGNLCKVIADHGIPTKKSFTFQPTGRGADEKVTVAATFYADWKWSAEMLQTMREYEGTILKLVKARTSLESEIELTKKKEVGDRWDQI